MLPHGFTGNGDVEGRCQQASHGLLPLRFAAQGYCWWNSRFLYDCCVIWNNYLHDFHVAPLRTDPAPGLWRFKILFDVPAGPDGCHHLRRVVPEVANTK